MLACGNGKSKVVSEAVKVAVVTYVRVNVAEPRRKKSALQTPAATPPGIGPLGGPVPSHSPTPSGLEIENRWSKVMSPSIESPSRWGARTEKLPAAEAVTLAVSTEPAAETEPLTGAGFWPT